MAFVMSYMNVSHKYTPPTLFSPGLRVLVARMPRRDRWRVRNTDICRLRSARRLCSTLRVPVQVTIGFDVRCIQTV